MYGHQLNAAKRLQFWHTALCQGLAFGLFESPTVQWLILNAQFYGSCYVILASSLFHNLFKASTIRAASAVVLSCMVRAIHW